MCDHLKYIIVPTEQRQVCQLVGYIMLPGGQDGATPLLVAVYNGHLEVVRYLVTVGCEKEGSDKIHALLILTTFNYNDGALNSNTWDDDMVNSQTSDGHTYDGDMENTQTTDGHTIDKDTVNSQTTDRHIIDDDMDNSQTSDGHTIYDGVV
ncbi:Hypothetical predicted protein [Mytilus galloprovincialis]|uniref:Uncharacterized protein n=1 Tax=Mytilus galloprovincialis TaxID=29158 RepID=A0A8B6FDN5_MYTGA|nr:Hypothetical predicted protein [Mytilus galloprovincialis]